jgi:hypothetical protein
MQEFNLITYWKILIKLELMTVCKLFAIKAK